MDIDLSQIPGDLQSKFDYFYSYASRLLDTYYPVRTITVTSRDPAFVTPDIKAMLQRKNRLMQAGRLEEAGALALRIGKEIRRQRISNLSSLDYKTDAIQVWHVVRQLAGKSQSSTAVPGITADSLNQHYAATSTDPDYQAPALKLSAAPYPTEHFTEW